MGIFDLIIGKSAKHSYHKAKIHRHGHRCYTEGLDHNEYALVSHLAQNLDSSEYFIFNNLTIPSSSTISSQIDHVIVSKYGIFVIESKHYNGFIFAHANRNEWTVTYRGGSKFKFQNPIIQNFGHVSALKEQLPFLRRCFFNIVTFSGDCVFKTDRINDVLYSEELVDCIKKRNRIWLQEEEIHMVIGKLLMLCQTNDIDLESHIKNLQIHHAKKTIAA